MNKKILFISVGILILAVVALLFFVKLRNKAGIQNVDQPSATSSATLPNDTGNSQQNIQEVKKTIQGALQEPISQQIVQNGSKLIQVKDGSGNPIPLLDFEKATVTTIIPQLRSYLDSKDYRIFYCPATNSEKDFGVYFGNNVAKTTNNLYPDTKAWMKDWEKTMLLNLHGILFPDVNFSEENLNQPLQFKDGQFRYTEVRLPGGKMGSINYHVSLNGVLISASPICLDKLVQVYEPLQP